MKDALLVPIHLDAFFVENEETVLHSTADFSKLPYFDGDHSRNSDVAYISEAIVSHPFRDKDLRLGKGVHLHWALPDALTQGVNTKHGLVFPSVPDRWLVTRSAPGVKREQWIIESDYLHPLDKTLDQSTIAKLAKESVTFPLPPQANAVNQQAWRYLGRKWNVATGAPIDINPPEYLNALAYAAEDKTAWHQMLEAGLTALGYGDPAFAAFYPNCRSVFGLHDADISFEDFKNSTYEIIGWYDNHIKRDCLQTEPLKHSRKVIEERYRKEFLESGLNKTQTEKSIGNLKTQIGHDALAHHFAWRIGQKWNPKTITWEEAPVLVDIPSRIICHASLVYHRAGDSAGVDIGLLDESQLGGIEVAVGNTASEALSAYLADKVAGDKVPGDKTLIEQQLEALDLGQRFQHRQLDIGPKFSEARHNKGFRARRAGILWTVRMERDPTYTDSDSTLHAATDSNPPIYIAHLLNQLNQLQRAFEHAEQEMESLRREIYHDWTLYMRALRPPEGLSDDYPDPVEIAKFIDRAGLTALRRLQAANGRFKADELSNIMQRTEPDVRSSPVSNQPVSDYTDPDSVAAQIANKIKKLNTAFDIANNIAVLLQRFDAGIATKKTDRAVSDTANLQLIQFLRKFDFLPTGSNSKLEASCARVHELAETARNLAELTEFKKEFSLLILGLVGLEGDEPSPELVKMRYVLRQIDGPRYYQPTDPVVLLAGKHLKPTERHGTDGKDNEDGNLICRLISNITISSGKDGTKSDNKPKILTELAAVQKAIAHIPDLNQDKTSGAKLDDTPDQPGRRYWVEQPWHPFMLEWQVEMFPVSAGSNRDEYRQTYADEFITENFNLAESAVDLTRKPGAAAALQSADSGLYSGSCILIDQAAEILQYKLNEFLKLTPQATVNPADNLAENSAENPSSAETPTQQKTTATLTKVQTLLDQQPGFLSQSLDGFHQALVQRHQILQIPITDPIGFGDMRPLTEAVRLATQGRHTSSPMRDNDFTPIRCGEMKLRKLRLVDTFGRVNPVISDDKKARVVRSETLALPSSPQSIKLPPRLVQSARLNFRWLSAEHAFGNTMDEPEANSHPAYTPVCGWLVPNNRDNIIEVFTTQGEALGAISQKANTVIWNQAPGSRSSHWKIDDPRSNFNPHLRQWLHTMVYELGVKASFFQEFMATLSNALESISPEDFSHHQSKALLMGRPIALVRAMVDLELRGRPAVNQSNHVFWRDLQRAVDPQPRQKLTKQRRAQFSLDSSEQATFLRALKDLDVSGIRAVFEKRQTTLPDDDDDIRISLKAMVGVNGRWQIALPTQTYQVSQQAGAVQVYIESDRGSDDFTHVQFPIRIGEYQQLNDGLIGYFIEQVDGDNYHYQDNCFYAPQAAARHPLALNCPANQLTEWVDELDQGKMPMGIATQLTTNGALLVTVDKTGHRWRVDSDHQVFNLIREAAGLALFELEDSSSAHIKVHWKAPINLKQSVDDAPQKLTMLVDPQGSVHAVSGILPTKSINIPADQYSKALSKLEITFPSRPILSEMGKVQLPLHAEQGYEWSWLSHNSELWDDSKQIDRIDTHAHFAQQQSLIEGWLKLQKTED